MSEQQPEKRYQCNIPGCGYATDNWDKSLDHNDRHVNNTLRAMRSKEDILVPPRRCDTCGMEIDKLSDYLVHKDKHDLDGFVLGSSQELNTLAS